MMKYLLAGLLLLSASYSSAQQLREFSKDYPTFLTEMQGLLETADKKKGEELFLEFSSFFSSSALSDTLKQRFVITANAMLKKRHRAFPDFENLIKFSQLAVNKLDAEDLLNWFVSSSEITLSNATGKSKDFMQTSRFLIEEGSIAKSGSSNWKVRNADIKYINAADTSYFIFTDADIYCVSSKDSLFIWETNALFYPLEEEIKGTGGTVFWERAKFDRDSVFAELKDYRINTRQNYYSADSASLHSKYYVEKVLLGKLEDKLTSKPWGNSVTYPQFASYDKEVKLNIAEDVSYFGGFAMEGARFKGFGTSDNYATVSFTYNDTVLLKCSSTGFTLRANVVSSAAANTIFYLDKDSIFHPMLQMRFEIDDRTLHLTRVEDGLSQTPVYNTYHEVDMYFTDLRWKMDEPKITMSNGKTTTTKPVTFESADYFTLRKYEILQGMGNRHPMGIVLRMIQKNDYQRTFPLSYIQEYMKMDENSTKLLIIRMSILGFADYEVEKDEVTFTERLFEFMEMKKGDMDYDVIRFISIIKNKSNATLSLLDYSMNMEGVGRILLSDSQDVVIFPKDQKITLMKNRDFDFSGQVKAGRFDMFGSDFHFNYENFFLNMKQIDSLRFKVPSFTPDENGARPLKQVRTPLRDLSGTLLIDKGFNKSGKESFSEFPIFKSGKDTYVYYDYDYIHGGAYKKEDFYFHVDPFELDSLDNFDTETLFFDGLLTSAGIFPEMRQRLTVQEDYSLGFEMTLQPGGVSAYGGKGKFENDLKLSNDGLVGSGVLSYITSTAESDAFLFFPDSTIGNAQAFNVKSRKEGVPFPSVLGKDDDIVWLPYQDLLHSSMTQSPYQIFEAGYTHYGNLTVSPDGLRGAGLLRFESAETESQAYDYGYNSFTSDRTAFRLDKIQDGPWTIKITNALARVDFDKRNGKFTLNEAEDYISFPLNEYICYMDEIDWDMDKRLIDIRNTGGAEYSPLVSVKESQDSLQFVAGRARYVMDDYFLEAFEVDHIDVADAAIHPNDKYVAIEKFAKMRTIKSADIFANRFDKYHKVYEATADIYSRNNYKAKGKLDYLDNRSTKYVIQLDTMGVDSGNSFAYGMIAEDDKFKLSPFFSYYGKVTLNGNERHLYMDGSTHIQSNCNRVITDWIPFHGLADPAEIIVDLSKIGKMGKTDTLYAGLVWAQDSAAIYGSFMGKLASIKDNPMFNSAGILWFDETDNLYKITSEARKMDPDSYDQYMSLDTRTCYVQVEGSFNLNERMNGVSLDPIGEATLKTRNGQLTMDVTMAANFFFSDDALAVMANDFYNEPTLGGIDVENPGYAMAVYKWMEKEKDADKYLEDMAIYGSAKKLPKELVKTIILTELKLNFDPEMNMLISKGDFGLASAGENQINLIMSGKIALEKGRTEDELYLYLEGNPTSTWFFYHYKRNRMEALGANNQFDTVLKELSPSKRSMKMETGPEYFFMLATSKRSLTKLLVN